MGTIYEMRIREQEEVTLSELLADAESFGMNRSAVEEMMKRYEGPYSVTTLWVSRGHRDGCPLDQVTVGLIHFLLADSSDALAEELGGIDKINSSEVFPTPETSPVSYAVMDDATADELHLRIWAPKKFAPEGEMLSSAAWFVDGIRYHYMKTNPDMRYFPPLGIGARFGYASNGVGLDSWKSETPLRELKAQLKSRSKFKIADISLTEEEALLLSTRGGHIAMMSLPSLEVRYITGPEDLAKTDFVRIERGDNGIFIQEKGGQWWNVDPETEASKQVEPPELNEEDPLAAGRQANISRSGTLTITTDGETETYETGVGYVRNVYPTPERDTWILETKDYNYFYYAPKNSLSRITSGGKKIIEWIGPYLFFARGEYVTIYKLKG